MTVLENARARLAGRAAPESGWSAEAWTLAGVIATPLRWVTGWLFFSAFWRRVVLAPAKLDPTSPAWNGKKINDFLPHSLGIGNLLEWLVSHPALLQVFLVGFTAVEALVGLALLLGLMTRLAALGTAVLSLGILLGAGWIGTTCLDEWQIGAAGIAGSLTVMLAGGGPWALDRLWSPRSGGATPGPLLRLVSSGRLGGEGSARPVMLVAGVLAAASLLVTLATNQVFAGGVWGRLHNDSKAPHLALSHAALRPDGTVSLEIYRDGGPDTYGAFVVEAQVLDSRGATVESFDATQLAALPATAITNHYVNKIKPGARALVVPLAAKADVMLSPASPARLAEGTYRIVLTDVSGAAWTTTATVS